MISSLDIEYLEAKLIRQGKTVLYWILAHISTEKHNKLKISKTINTMNL